MSNVSSLTLSGKLRRDAGIVGLLFASTTSMVGSGWLFGAYHAARIAGPLSIGSWVLVMWLVGAIFLLPFPAWQQMVNYITWMTVLTCGLGPIALLVLRRNLPQLKRPFRVTRTSVIAPLAFICSNLGIYWAGFKTSTFLFSLVAPGFVLYVVYYHVVMRKPASRFGWKHVAWLFLPWFGGIWVLSWLGNIGGGRNVIGFGWDILLVAVWSVIVMLAAMRCALGPDETMAMMQRMDRTS